MTKREALKKLGWDDALVEAFLVNELPESHFSTGEVVTGIKTRFHDTTELHVSPDAIRMTTGELDFSIEPRRHLGRSGQ